MYDNLSSRLRGEAEVSDATPYIKELMKQAADALDHFENITRTFQSLSAAPTIIPADHIGDANEMVADKEGEG